MGKFCITPVSYTHLDVYKRQADVRGAMQLQVEIFNAHHATTWTTHRASTRVVCEVTAEQAGSGRVRLGLEDFLRALQPKAPSP